MIGTELIESLVQATALSHLVKGHARVSLLLLAAPESGKTTITTAATCRHVSRIAVMSGRSILRELRDDKQTEFLLFNDLTAIRAMSFAAVNLLLVLLNQLTQGERGSVAFAGKDKEMIEREIGIIGCLPFDTFADNRARWRELGFVSRMIPFAYRYSEELVAEIKDAIDGDYHAESKKPAFPMPRRGLKPITVTCPPAITRSIRELADARAEKLGELGIRLLRNYHSLIRAHALLKQRHRVTKTDLAFLEAVNHFVSITDCAVLPSAARQKAIAASA